MFLLSRRSSAHARRSRLRQILGASRSPARRLGMETLENRRVLAGIEVTTLLDVVDSNDGVVSLREAVASADTGATITFAPSLFTSGPALLQFQLNEIAITDSLTINGPGSDLLTLAGGRLSRFFAIDDGNPSVDSVVNISGLTLAGGNGHADSNVEKSFAGAILSRENLTVSRSRFVDNDASFGAGIVSYGPLLVTESTFDGNTGSFAGAILNYGVGTVSHSTVVDNAVVGNGAGLRNEGTLTVVGSTITGNVAQGNGGGISNTGTLTVLGSTIAGNVAVATEGGGGIFSEGGSVTLANNIVAGNFKVATTASDIEGAGYSSSSSFNLVGDAATAGGLSNGVSGNIVGVDWKTVLENDGTAVTLKNNGGVTQTILLATGSPAIDKGNGALLPSGTTTDQRGVARTLDLTAVANAAGGDGTDLGAVEIVGSTQPARASISRSSLTINEAGGVGTFIVSLSEPSGSPVTVSLKLFGSATNTVDYTRSGTEITIPAGETSGSITVTAIQDQLDEVHETIYADIVNVVGGVSDGFQRSVIFILDDDPQPTVTLSRGSETIVETGGATTFTATLSAVSGIPVTVNLGFSGRAILNTDYTVSSSSIVIPAGQLSGSITVNATSDLLDELNETVVADITTVAGATESGVQTATTFILDDDPLPSVTLSRASATIAEAGGATTFTAQLSAVSGRQVTVNLGFRGAATLNGDYSASSNQIIIPAGQLTGSITVTAIQDVLDEANEAVIVDIVGVIAGVESGVQSVFTAIQDDDLPVEVTLSTDVSSISEDGGVATVTATLAAPSSFTVTVFLGFSGTTSHLDYTPSALRIRILPGQLSGSITLTALQDTIAEPTEVATLDIIAVANGVESGNQSVSVSILDDDSEAPLMFSMNEDDVDEVMSQF